MLLDSLPAWARYLLVLVVLAPLVMFVSAFATLVVASGGLFGIDIDWAAEAAKAGNASAVSAASGVLSWLALYVLPITRQFGVGSKTPTIVNVPAPAPELEEAGE